MGSGAEEGSQEGDEALRLLPNGLLGPSRGLIELPAQGVKDRHARRAVAEIAGLEPLDQRVRVGRAPRANRKSGELANDRT